ncbi:1,4-dihydroxy-2-naphthoate prenyltransferase, partial [Lactobacillus sp. XV13L]|nr:1,4-dihydroxy-2-naphthoate prenyltransferase [Lactobacillus sp. XV13L]
MEARNKYDRLTLHKFLEFERLNTKLASVMPFLTGILFTYYYFHTFNWQNTLIYLVAQSALTLFVTGFNNVQDYRLAKSSTYRKEQTLIGQRNLSPVTLMNIMIFLVVFSAVVGIWLTIKVDPFIWLIGVPAFMVGIGYTYGPTPISRIPLGELLSGLFEGFGVGFMTVYVNSPVKQLASLSFNWPHFALSGNLANLLIIFWVMVPQIFLTSAIMLANNTSDLEEDLTNNRHTLPSYIGIPA